MNGELVWLGVTTGLGLGGLYILVGLSYTLVLASSGIFNFTQAAILSLGSLIAFTGGVRLHLDGVVVAGIVVGSGAVIGFITELLTVAPFVRRITKLTEEALVSTLGMGLAGTAALTLIFGGSTRSVNGYIQPESFQVLGLPLRTDFVFMLGAAIVVAGFLDVGISRSNLGVAFRAVVEDREGASLLGIDAQKLLILSFVVAGALSGLAGYLLAPATGASALVGNNVALMGFAAMAVGGYGSFRGVIVGGLVVGLVNGLVPVFMTSSAILPITLGVLVSILIWRPHGLFGVAGQFGSASVREV